MCVAEVAARNRKTDQPSDALYKQEEVRRHHNNHPLLAYALTLLNGGFDASKAIYQKANGTEYGQNLTGN
jgi:hypothetical protein